MSSGAMNVQDVSPPRAEITEDAYRNNSYRLSRRLCWWLTRRWDGGVYIDDEQNEGIAKLANWAAGPVRRK